MILSRRFVMTGRVQEVGFRIFAGDAARREGLAGHVRNLADGRVEAVATGNSDALLRFERSMHTGPPLSRVDDVAVEELATDLSTHGFRVR